MRSDDLLAAVFPDQVACQENRSGPIEPPDHPLVNETVLNCLHEAMDLDGLIGIVEAMDRGEIRAVAVETPAPSPMSHELLNANPYAFLDDAPLEERRARAVSLRRTDPDLASGLGSLDPAAIQEVRRQAWPEARDADEAHDALLTLCLLPEADAAGWQPLLDALVAGSSGADWCDRALLARIHRLSLGRLRKEIEAVSPVGFLRFLLHWQHAQPRTQLHGRDGVLEIIRQLEGLELPGPAWERDVLPTRISDYDPTDL